MRKLLVALLLLAPAVHADFEEARARARSAHEAQRLEEAAAAYQEALAERPDWAEGWWALGTIFYGLDRYSECRDALRKLVAIELEVGLSRAFLGLCEFQTGDHREALANLERARALGVPAESGLLEVAQFHLAVLLTAASRFEEALHVLQGMAARRPLTPQLQQALGQAFLRIASLPEDMPESKRPLVGAAGRIAYLVAARRTDEAQPLMEAFVQRYSSEPNVHYAYGIFLLTGDSDRALEEFRKELEVSPDHVPARLQIAFEYLKRGEYAAGLPFAREAVELWPEDFAARHAYGRLLLGAGRTAEAIDELEKAVALEPASPQTRFALARAYARAGRQKDAAREQQEFLRLQRLAEGRREP